MVEKVIVATIDYDGFLTGIGRAPKVAIAKVSNGTIASAEEKEVRWDEAHEKEQEGLHHSNVAKFFIANKATDIVAGGAGPDMRRMIERLGIKLHIASGYYRDAIKAIAEQMK
ncbi:MAG: NifB/NifX family molybdenum-iron cluster-binding protein [Candidatus Micrarchaeia archaeon]